MSSSKKGQIESAKIVIGEVFSRFWFRIPDYQRAYVWGKDEISELIDDVNYASEHNPEGQYFLGSMVLRKATRITDGVSFEEYELLDGQQRLTTLMLMLACIRDRVVDDKLKDACREMLFQEENKWKKIPGRNRPLVVSCGNQRRQSVVVVAPCGHVGKSQSGLSTCPCGLVVHELEAVS